MEDKNHLKKYVAVKEKVRNIKYFVIWKDGVPENLDKEFVGRVITWEQLMDVGRKFKALRAED